MGGIPLLLALVCFGGNCTGLEMYETRMCVRARGRLACMVIVDIMT